MGETLSLFTTSFNRSLAVEARPERLSRDAGAVLLREILERTGIVAWLIERLADPRHPSLVTYTLADLLRTVLVLFGQGWRDQNDADALRFDPALRLAATGQRGTTPLAPEHHLASQPTLSRLLDTLSTDVNRRVLREAVAESAGRRLRAGRGGHRQRHLTLDVDSLPIEVHGHQPGSAWNGHYHQRMYHPLVACAAETGDLLDARLRPGNAHTAEGALAFILDLVDRVEAGLCQIALVRLDAGFPDEPLLAGLEARGTRYVARLRHNRALERLAAPHLRRPAGRPPAEPRLWCHELSYRAGSWSRPRRVVLIVLERPGELLLEHFWLITSLSVTAMPAPDLLELYRQRCIAPRCIGRGVPGRADGHPGTGTFLGAARQAPLSRAAAAELAERHGRVRAQRGALAAAPFGLPGPACRALPAGGRHQDRLEPAAVPRAGVVGRRPGGAARAPGDAGDRRGRGPPLGHAVAAVRSRHLGRDIVSSSFGMPHHERRRPDGEWPGLGRCWPQPVDHPRLDAADGVQARPRTPESTPTDNISLP